MATTDTASAVLGGGTSANQANGSTQINYLSALNTSLDFNPYGLFGQLGIFLGNQFATPNANINSNNQLVSSARSSVSNALMSSTNPLAIGLGILNTGIDKTGGYTDTSSGYGRYDTANSIASFVPGLGYLTGKTNTYAMSDSLKRMNLGYRGSYALGNKALKNSGIKALFGRSSINKDINTVTQQDNAILNIEKTALDAQAQMLSMTLTNALTNLLNRDGGMGLARAAKEGAKLDITNNDAEFFLSLKLGGTLNTNDDTDFFNSLEFVLEFQKGGSINVIPEGALHAHKHHMENAEHLTKKGIPVVSDNEGGQLVLQAEIERNEIVFRLEVSLKLEEWYKLYKDSDSQNEKDALAIKAGKLLASEIIDNTEDRTGLINEV